MQNEKRLIDADAKFIEKHFTKRLIDSEAIARKLKRQYCAECNVVRQIQCSACWVNDVLELLDGDSVDAVEVVHSKWDTVFYERNGELATYSHICPICKYHYKNMWKKGYNYCPNCGAKMDGDGNGNS